MTYTNQGTKTNNDWMPLAMANGIEWSNQRKAQPDRFDCLYRCGIINKMLWYIGAFIGVFITLK